MGEMSLREGQRPKDFIASITKEQLNFVNLTDLQFTGLCKEKYGVNKGLYNTIENYFAKKGIRNILYRRVYILEFLNDVQRRKGKECRETHVTFGSGGLAKALHNFFIKNI